MTAAVPRFRNAGPFALALKTCLDEYGHSTPLHGRVLAYRLKIALLLTWLLVSYVVLVFVASGLWQIASSMGSLVLAAAAVSFNVMHDAAHGAASTARSVNRVLAMSLDLLGGSSYIWHWKHNVLHHTFPNIEGVDSDIDLWPFARTSEGQPRYRLHRYQHIYMWALYGFVPLRWYAGDLRFLVTPTLLGRRFPRPRGGELIALIAWKLVYVSWALAIPMLYHPAVDVLLVWLLCLYFLGLILSITFQLSHCVQGTHFPPPLRDDGERAAVDADWFVHQIRTTANFAAGNRLLTWYLGGLNHQIEHHLFPSVCHVHYPRLAPRVRQTCAQFGVAYVVHRTLVDAVSSHYSWLRRLGAAGGC